MDRTSELMTLSLVELRPMAKKLKIKKYSSLNKDILIEQIVTAEKNNCKKSTDEDDEDEDDDNKDDIDEGEALIEIKKKLDDLNKLFTTLILKRA